MSNVIGVINYGVAGNIHSITKALEISGGTVIVVNNPDEFDRIDKLVIPGVGSFKGAMSELEKSELLEPLKKAILTKPTLGICLGMQILSTLGFEYGKTKGLGLVNAEVKGMLVDAKVPHVGFNQVKVTKPNKLFDEIEDAEFYFMHSYEVVNYTDILSLTNYAGHEFVSSIQKGDVFGVQFHPEKSREAGIKLFKNFLDY